VSDIQPLRVQPLATPPPPPDEPIRPSPQFRFYYYCTEEDHPGVPRYNQDPLDVGRIFGTDDNVGCPICPGCGREVSAVPCAGPSLPPLSVIEFRNRWVAQQTGR
jgi:hypothetical protein